MYIGIDIGGTNIRIGIATSLENPSFIRIKRFKNTTKYNTDIVHIIETIRDLIGNNKIEGIGISSAGIISKDKTMLAFAEMMSDWNHKPLVKDLEKAFTCEVKLNNDAYCASMAEATYGYGKKEDFIYIVWGTGIGGASVTHTEKGISIDPFEPGHQSLNWKGRLCPCGQRGCAELYCSGRYLSNISKGDYSQLTLKTWDKVNNDLAHMLFNTLLIRPTNIVVFGGGVAINQHDNVKKVQKYLLERMTLYKVPKIYITEMKDDIGLFGGLALLNN